MGLQMMEETGRSVVRERARVRAFATLLVLVTGISAWFVPTAGAAGTYDILVSTSPTRNGATSLQGATVSGSIYAFVSPETGVSEVRFWIDDPSMATRPFKTERGAPWDLAGTNGDGTAKPFNTGSLADGQHSLTALVTVAAGGSEVVTSTFTIANGSTAPYSMQLSTSPDRSNAVEFDGQTVNGSIYVFTTPTVGVSEVRFYLDNTAATGTPTKRERGAPFDLAGSNQDGTAKPYDTTHLSDGPHTMTAAIVTGSGTVVITRSFSVNNGTIPALVFDRASVSFSAPSGGVAPPDTVRLATSDGSATPFTLVESPAVAWLSQSSTGGTTTASVELTVDTSGLASGTYSTTLTASAVGFTDDTLPVHLRIDSGCTPVPCSEILVDLPYELDWAADHGKILDKDEIGTGFTKVDQPSRGTGYIPGNLDVDLATGTLAVTTTNGLAFQAVDSQDNALGVGIDAPSQITRMSSTLSNPPAGTGNSEQAGLWFGNDEDNYVKLIVLSGATGTKIQYAIEVAGSSTSRTLAVNDLSSSRVTLTLRMVPTDRTITGTFSINGGTAQTVTTFTAPDEFFSFDAAGIDPTIGTRSFGGIFASHRNGPAPLVYRFDSFSVRAESTGGGGGGGGGAEAIAFDRSSFPVQKPTSMAWGPDGRLYVTEFFGKIHRITLDADKNVMTDEVVTTLGSRLTLGITVDPESTPSNVILWVSHSSPSLNDGVPNSSTITRLSGPGLTAREDVITGLPRAKANHAVNSIHFGPDGKLYIAAGGNTGAGAPNDAGTEFGTMEEQPLSAALLVADVKASGFDGSCNNETNIFGPPPCDVEVYSSGLRNMYDFVFHTNGSLYGPDNGLGVTGSYPPSATPPCLGFGDTASWTQGGDNPGRQPDTLERLLPGKYYGHPNPYRDECVFGDGHYQGVAPLPNYVPPMYDLGNNRSANGTIEYVGDAFCGALENEILITNYSIGDDVTRLRLSPDGSAVVSAGSLAGGFNDPLPITQGPDGTIYVGEFGGNLVTALIPQDLGCWSASTPAPQAYLDAGGTAIDGRVYTVAGKTSSVYLNTLRIFAPSTGWSTGPNLPGVGVENPAVTSLGGKLYVFGGSTDAFSGAVSNAAVYDPGTNSWTQLAAMNVARGGATAAAVGTKIYVMGGLDVNGASLASVSVYDTVTDSWSSVASMGTARDNAGAASLGGRVYVFGGRTRLADGTTTEANLATVEMFDPSTGTWTSRASMPTGRRTMAVAVVNGRALVIGGERRADGTAFVENEEYDPVTDSWRTLTPVTTGRHGAVAGVVNGVVYVIGGATNASTTSATSVNEAFAFGT